MVLLWEWIVDICQKVIGEDCWGSPVVVAVFLFVCYVEEGNFP